MIPIRRGAARRLGLRHPDPYWRYQPRWAMRGETQRWLHEATEAAMALSRAAELLREAEAVVL